MSGKIKIVQNKLKDVSSQLHKTDMHNRAFYIKTK